MDYQEPPQDAISRKGYLLRDLSRNFIQVRRVKQFSKGGAGRIDFIELPNPMTKIEALKYMLTCKEFSSEDDQATIQDVLEDKEREARKGSGTVKATVSLDAIKNRPRKDVTVADILETING